MPRKLRKSVRGYLSKIKSANSTLHFSASSFSSSKSWILRGCKHVKTLSFSGGGGFDNRRGEQKHDNSDGGSNSDGNKDVAAAATLADVDQFLFENFRSLYIKDDDDDDDNEEDDDGGDDRDGDEKNSRRTKNLEADNHYLRRKKDLFDEGSPRLPDPPGKRSNRSLIRPVGSSSWSSGSLADETVRSSLRTTSSMTDDMAAAGSTVSNTLAAAVLPEDCIAVLSYTRAPQDEFGRSMQEMVAARLEDKGSVDWEFMEELLFGYLNLNEKKSHRFILSAFVDLIVGMRPAAAEERAPARARRCFSGRGVLLRRPGIESQN